MPKKYDAKAQKKVGKVMREFKEGKLEERQDKCKSPQPKTGNCHRAV